MNLIIKKATTREVGEIKELLDYYAKKGDLLPRSFDELYQCLRDFWIAKTAQGRVVGCVALHISWEDIGEIRSLAVQKRWQSKGVGKQLVQAALAEAKDLGLQRVFALTLKGEYFKKLGFESIDRNQLPKKIWADCIKCPHFPNCNEDAFIIEVG